LISADGGVVTFGDLLEWCYSGRRAWRQPIYMALARYGENVGYGRWQANDELRKLIRGE
jgi:hypothetical protein